MMSIGETLKQIREQKGISQMEISSKLGYKSNSYVSSVEIGLYIPTAQKLRKWARALRLAEKETENLLLESRVMKMDTLMLKDVPDMTTDEKQSVIEAYKVVLEARAKKELKTRKG